MSRLIAICLAAAAWAALLPLCRGQSLAANPTEERLGSDFNFTVGWWFSQIEDRSPFAIPSADSTGPAFNFRADLIDYLSAGITFVSLSGDVAGTLVDPFVEVWATPPSEKHAVYAGAYLGYHFGDYEYRGTDPRFQFPGGSTGTFHDNGFFGGIEAWLPLLDWLNLKGTVSWYPQVSDANFFDPNEMHAIYSVGFGVRVSDNLSFSVLGALSPIADDGLLIIGATLDL